MSAEQGSNSPADNSKVKVVGRIGQEATFKTIPDKEDLLIGNLSIAEHPDRDTTIWHDIAIFGERARRMQEQFTSGELKVGQEVEVVGALHRRERPTKDGGTRTVEQIYAYSLKPYRRDVQTDAPAESPAEPAAVPEPELDPDTPEEF